jgi:hypothetical protein
MITEAQIERIINSWEENPNEFQIASEKFISDQPALAQFLFQEDFDVLNAPEKEYLFYISLVLYTSAKSVLGQFDPVLINTIEAAEERNWETWEKTKTKVIQEKNNVFFENYEQEDLLAFVEDMVLDDEENELSYIAQEICMVAGKTIIDVLAPTTAH